MSGIQPFSLLCREPSIKYEGRPLGGRPLSRQREAVVIMDPSYGWSKTTSTRPGSPPDYRGTEARGESQFFLF